MVGTSVGSIISGLDVGLLEARSALHFLSDIDLVSRLIGSEQGNSGKCPRRGDGGDRIGWQPH